MVILDMTIMLNTIESKMSTIESKMPATEQVGNLSEHARAKRAAQLCGIHAARVYKKAQLCKYCQLFGTNK